MRARTGDWLILVVAERALLLQVAHPVVAAGVEQHSTFRTDPWGRLERTLGRVATISHGPDPAGAAADLRTAHRSIQGRLPEGGRYHAFDPDAWRWVHETLLDSLFVGLDRYGRPWRPGERQALFEEFQEVGSLLGIPDRDLAPTWLEHADYMRTMVAEGLEDNDLVQELLATPRDAPPPPVRAARLAWPVVRPPAARVVRLVTTGLLPGVLRERWGLRWTATDRREFAAAVFALRRVSAVLDRLPDRLRLYPAFHEALQDSERPAA
jgi:uncharacterized protein (DUF2236 family)